MAYAGIDRKGDTVRSPSVKQMRQLLASLVPGDTDPVSIVYDGQWFISAAYSGLVCLENQNTVDGPWHMAGVPVARILELWQLLSAGSIEEIRSLSWSPGNGI
jgi:hypothetical protein